MISDKITKLLNEKITREQTNEMIYSSSRAYCANQNLPGFEKYYAEQATSEYEHKHKVMEYMSKAQANIEILPVTDKIPKFTGVQEIVNKGVELEWLTLGLYEDIKKAAEAENDGLTYDFALEMIRLQRDEIDEATDLQYKVARIASNDKYIMGIGINAIDAELLD